MTDNTERNPADVQDIEREAAREAMLAQIERLMSDCLRSLSEDVTSQESVDDI